MPYDLPQSRPFYPPVSYAHERAFSGPFRRSAEGFHDLQNKPFLDECRSPGSYQVYQEPHFEAFPQAPSEQAWSGESPCELRKPLAQGNKLRGDAPEFVPRGKCAVNEESRPKVKKPCWLVVSG
ncbi:hypothetical protein ASPVEDRAFT_120187 [Aspergillus versicolor CBS 583.65]|uniref:Uncharacterized protein n=1 Tax=Aspergillus versicolor CBS 583.65 TaxID=1036611 RepID=A0A1L9P6P5_ASPVE|nr:uncharacterized protein ASPVEDRAFT_120187 [Aspergillus versicolor CBS 583.65]OJI97103.1 hypothetical protein ASPVEDRAFT_120187 [Aspergillus versicolor CBS 583.65]